MASSDDVKKQHDVTTVPVKTADPLTPEDEGDEEIEGGEEAQDIDKVGTKAFGNEPSGTISEEVNEDEEENLKGKSQDSDSQ